MATSLGIENTTGWTDQQLASLESYANASSTLFVPSLQNGYNAWSLELDDATATVNFPASTHGLLTRIYVPANCTVGHVDYYFTTTGTTTVFLSGLYSATGAQLATSVDAHAAIVNTALTPVAFAASANLVGGNYYYLFTTITWSVQPVLAGVTYPTGGSGGAIAFGNAGVTLASAPITSDYGVQATLPASLTLSGQIGYASKVWAGLRA
jgi:hypothetical protein